MLKQIVVPTGYMGSGSSAITDIIAEIDGYTNDTKEFEFVFLHCPNGLFDLEDKLLYGNNSIRSDEALHSFYKQMSTLYEQSSLWFCGYSSIVSPDFIKWTKEFIDSLIISKSNESYWYYQQIPSSLRTKFLTDLKSWILKYFDKSMSAITPREYREMWLSYPTEDKFYNKANIWITKVLEAISSGEKIIVDQLLLPHNLHRLNNYFDEKLKVFVVDRDPRDVFILNKYYWSLKKCPVPYPLDVYDYCRVYRSIRESEKIINDNRIIRLHFEDLVYNYESTLNRIYLNLGISPSCHIQKGTRFNPQKSIINTQLFLKKQYQNESDIIKEELEDFLYPFPYEVELGGENIF